MRATISGSMRVKGFAVGPANQNGQGTKLFGLITLDGGLEKKAQGWGSSEMDLAFELNEYNDKKIDFLQKQFKAGATFMFTGQLGNINLGHGNQVGVIISEIGYGMKQETGNGGFNQGGGYNNNNGNMQKNNNQGGGFGGNFQQNNGTAAAPQQSGYNQNQMAAQVPQNQGNFNQNQQQGFNQQNGFPQQEPNAFANPPAAQQPQNGFPMPQVGAGVTVSSGNDKDEFPF